MRRISSPLGGDALAPGSLVRALARHHAVDHLQDSPTTSSRRHGPNIEALAAVRVDGGPTRDVDRSVTYCDLVCYAQHQEVWRVGGVAYGVDLGLRLVLP